MFTERKMEEAIEWLFDLFEPEDYEAYDEEEMGRTGGLYLPEVCIALRDRAESIYEYTVDSFREQGFDYRGKELFDKRGCMIMSQVDQAAIGEEEIFYNTELWLMEDMTFVIVRCVSMLTRSDFTGYTTEYRSFKKNVEELADLFFTPEELIDELEAMCAPQWEHEATIYEL